MATKQRRKLRGGRPPPPLDSPEHESKATCGALLPQRATDATARTEWVCGISVFVLALVVRLYRIGYPSSVVFDEVHFLRFVKNYHDGQYLFDIHPPLGKLILLAVSKIFCATPSKHLVHNGMPFPPDYAYIPLRVASALFGAATSPVLLFIARALGLALPAALLPALAHAVDNLSVVEGRVVVMDAQLTLFMALALLCALHLFGAREGTKARKRWLVATAIAASCAVSVKWTTGVTPLLIAIVSLFGLPFMRRSLRVSEMAAAGGTAIALYTFFFAIHFWLLPSSGEGDAFMPLDFQRTLRNNTHYVPGFRGPSFMRSFLYLNAEMYRANARIKTRHHWESKWYQWVINMRGLLYFDEPHMEKYSRIYLIVNPAIAFIALGAVFASIALLLGVYVPGRLRKQLEPYSKLHAFAARATFLLAGYLLNLVPYLGTFLLTPSA